MSRTLPGSAKIECPQCHSWQTIVTDSRGPIRIRVCGCGHQVLTREVIEDPDYRPATITSTVLTR